MTNYKVHCDCGAVEISMTGTPKVHAFCHCEDCRELLQVPYHSVLAWEADSIHFLKGRESVIELQHPSKPMKRILCKACGDVIYNTNAMGRKLVAKIMYKKCNHNKLPQEFESNAHFFYGRRIVNIDDELPKK